MLALAPHLVLSPHPLRLTGRVAVEVEDGTTLAEALVRAGWPSGRAAEVYVGDRRVERGEWATTRLRAGDIVTVKAAVAGGGGQGGGKNVLRIVAIIAVVIVSILTAGATAGLLGPLLGTTVSTATGFAINVTVGSLIVNALIPPVAPRPPDTPAADRPANSITGSRNQLLRFGKIPGVLGKRRMFPPYYAIPYQEAEGNKQYVRMLFAVWGPNEVSELRFGDNPIFAAGTAITYTGKMTGDGVFSGVEVEVRKGNVDGSGASTDAAITLYPDVVSEDSVGVELLPKRASDTEARWTRRTTQRSTTRISVDLVWPALVLVSDEGKKKDATSTVKIRYRLVGTTTWTDRTNVKVTAHSTSAIRRTDAWDVTAGQYEVECARQSAAAGDSGQTDAVFWSILRSFRSISPVGLAGLTLIAIRVKATNQLNGTPDDFSAVFHSILPDFDSGTSTWPERTTSNPASCYRAVLQGRMNRVPVADGRIALDDLEAWHTANATAGRECNLPVDDAATTFDRLRVVAATGRASFGLRDGRFSVVRDVRQTVPVTTLGPRIYREFSFSKRFYTPAHALKVSFADREDGWQENEVTVYDDGYNLDGTGGKTRATVFEKLSLPGVTSWDQAWREGRYYLAAARLRPWTVDLVLDFEHLRCERGDLVRVNSDVPRWGAGDGRVVEIRTSGADVTGFRASNVVPVLAASSYSVRLRKPDGSYLQRSCSFAADGDTDEIVFTTPISAGAVPAVGDYFLFGLNGADSEPMIVKAVTPLADLCARVTLVPQGDEIHDADTGTSPARVPIGSQPLLQQTSPAPPDLDEIETGTSGSSGDETTNNSSGDPEPTTSSTATSSGGQTHSSSSSSGRGHHHRSTRTRIKVKVKAKDARRA